MVLLHHVVPGGYFFLRGAYILQGKHYDPFGRDDQRPAIIARRSVSGPGLSLYVHYGNHAIDR
jgi:hypothetical protein